MSLSVCIITLNEEANIGRTLNSVKDIADEIILVDSGSTDGTVSMAQSIRGKGVRGAVESLCAAEEFVDGKSNMRLDSFAGRRRRS